MFSVLIAVYAKELPQNLQQSLESIFRQELMPDEVVLVEDGPLTAELEQVVTEAAAKHQELHIIKIAKNKGLGLALQEGIKHCHYDIVARMDSDDIAHPERFKKEMAWLEAHPETDVVGSWVDEFSGDPSQVISTRRLPETHEEILRFSRYRNPMNHPTVMMRKEAVMRAGNYQHLPLFEDYDLWVRMLRQGARFHNLQESLLSFRLTSQLFSRRGGRHYIRQEIKFQRHMRAMGHIGYWQMSLNIVVRTLLRVMPKSCRRYGYLFFLRR